MTADLTIERIQAALESPNEQVMLDLQADIEELVGQMVKDAPQQATQSLGRVGYVPNP